MSNKRKKTKKEMHVLPLFATPVAVIDYNSSFTKKDLKYIMEMEKRSNVGNQTSTDSYVLTRNKTLQKIYNFVLECANNYFQEIYQPSEHIEIYITQSWFNYSAKGQFHHLHSHPNSFISGVMYIQAEENTDKITFHREKSYDLSMDPKQYNNFNSESWWVPAKTGRLLIFPSSLQHSVPPVVSDKTRISLSFNTFLKGNLGTEISLTQLKLLPI